MTSESRELRVLVVEDSEDDVELLLLELRRGGWKPTYERVETPGALRDSLSRRRWDIVLSDYAMPAFTGLDAFRIVREAGLDLPFVLVSGTVGEERAVEAVKSGIHDYLLKGQLTRLGSAIERELREAVSRRRHAIQSAVTHVLASLRTTSEVNASLLAAIAVPMGWIEAELWLAGDGGRLDRGATWSPDGGHPAPAPGNASLAERVVASGGPAEGTAEPGAAPVVAFPIEHGGVAIGAMLGHPGPQAPPAGPLLDTLLGVGIQIGECVARQQAERQLLESEQRYRTLVGSLSVGVVLLDAGLVVRAMNPAAERILELSAMDLVGLSPLPDPACDADGAPLRPEDGPARRVLATGRPVTDVVLGFDSPAGTRRWISMNAEPIVAAGSTAPGRVVASFTDVTQKRLLEEQLRQSQKMEALGRLAGGVAHDFNNILTTILGFSELLLASLPPGSPMQEDLSEIHKAGERAAALTRQLLSFSRRQAVEPQVLDLNVLSTDLERMLSRLVGNVTLRLVLAPDLGYVRADRGQLEQVVMNLVVNASDAMPDGGTLTIRSGNVDLAEAWELQHLDLVAGRYVKLSVTDTGSGMPPEILDHVFEPFFTTKGPGKGTGLGLATVYGIVKQAGGLITVESEVGRGTTFTVYLPRVAAGAGEGDGTDAT